MDRLAIIIPTLNAADDLAACLASVGGPDGPCRIIVSDGGSTDETLGLARRAGATVVTGPPGRGGQLRRGAEAAEGEARWLLFLHADTRLPPDWRAIVSDHIGAHPGKAAVFRLRFDATGIAPAFFAAMANIRSRLGLPYGDQGLLIPLELYQNVGGYPDIPLMEDVVIARRLAGRLRLLPARVETSARRYQAEGWLRRGARNLLTLLSFLAGRPPESLTERYYRGGERRR